MHLQTTAIVAGLFSQQRYEKITALRSLHSAALTKDTSSTGCSSCAILRPCIVRTPTTKRYPSSLCYCWLYLQFTPF